MSQRRLNIFGDFIDAMDLPDALSHMFSAGRYSGNVFSVADSSHLRLSAGAFMLPNGVVVLEDEYKDLLIPNSSAPISYTVLYQSEDDLLMGGSPAILKLVSGLYQQETFTDSTVMGWVVYQGGSVPLSASHFFQPNYLRVVSAPSTFLWEMLSPLPAALRVGAWQETTSYTESTGESVTKWQSPINTSGVTSTQTVRIPFIVKNQPQKLVIRMHVDIHCYLDIKVNIGGTLLSVASLVSNTSSLASFEYNLPFTDSSIWQQGKTACVEINISSTQSARSASIAYVAMTSEQLPFSIFS